MIGVESPSSRNKGQWFLRNFKTSKMNPMIAPVYCLEKVSRLWYKEGKPCGLPKLRRQSCKSREDPAVSRRTVQVWESYMKRELCSSAEDPAEGFSRDLISTVVWRNYPRMGKNPSKGLREHCPEFIQV